MYRAVLVESRPGHIASHTVLGDPVALCGHLYPPLKMRIKNCCPAYLQQILWSEKARNHTSLLCFKFHPVQIFVIVLSQRACKTYKKNSLLCFYKLRNLPWLRKLAGKNSHLVLINYRRFWSRMELASCLYAEFKWYFLACGEPFLNYIKWKIWKRII